MAITLIFGSARDAASQVACPIHAVEFNSPSSKGQSYTLTFIVRVISLNLLRLAPGRRFGAGLAIK